MTSPNQSTPTSSMRTLAGPVFNFLTVWAINPVMRLFLNRGIGSKTLMMLQFKGKQTGQTYNFPVGYMQQGQTVFCYSPFSWWRNLRGGAPVTVVVKGQHFDRGRRCVHRHSGDRHRLGRLPTAQPRRRPLLPCEARREPPPKPRRHRQGSPRQRTDPNRPPLDHPTK